MKSVGEVMAIGRTFSESVQKALRSMETGLSGFDDIALEGLGAGDDKNVIRAAVSKPTPDRLLKVAQALRLGFDVEQVHASCRIDPWFLDQIADIISTEARVKAHGLPKSAEQMRALKAMGFSDARLAKLAGLSEKDVREHRAALAVHPVFKRIDTCAAEFAAPTAYMYSTYESGLVDAPACEANPSEAQKVIILGGGPNRIGQGIEFDYCCCHACFSLTAAGFETIMINCNPETVSTDYDTSDRLYFEPLTAEDVLEIVLKEQSKGTLKGVIVQFGGQTPLKLAAALEEAGVPILGTSPDAIDLAEDRDRFKVLIDKLGLKQPKSGIARSPQEARAVADSIGYPVVIRPSYVLGGRAMEIVHDGQEVDRYVTRLSASLDRPSELVVSDKRPLLIDSYLTDAVEVDVDCLADGKDTFVAGIMEHIEEAGIHSGDSACALPPHSLSPEMLDELARQTRELALALKVVGLMNVQFAIKDGTVYVLEVNPRASRTVPFVAKVIGKPIAAIAAEVMAGKPLAEFGLKATKLDHVAVKEAVFPFARFPGVDPILGPEMRSTGEVMGIDRDFPTAFVKSQLASGQVLPLQGTVFISVKDADKDRIVAPVRELEAMGFKIVATRGTKRHLETNGIQCDAINKVLEGRPHIVDAMKNGDIDLVFNTTEGAKALADSKDIRRTALLHHIPYYTTLSGAVAVTRAIRALKAGTLQVAPLQSFVSPPS
jgi:carbamoyl-phosphate synthase large subunit